MPLDLGSLELYMGPNNLGAPDNLETTIISFINGARQSLYIAVQELESESITRALINARQRGIIVRLILEGQYLTVRNAVPNPFIPGGNNEENRRLHAALLRADLDIISDLNPETFHQKFIVRDHGTSNAAVLTGSTNFTPTGVSSNLNHIIILRSQRIVNLFLEEFEESWSGTFGQLNERHGSSPREYRLSHIRVKVLFSPDHAPELEIMKQMLKATNTINFAIFTFAESSGIDDTMRVLAGTGINITGILDRRQANQSWSASHNLLGQANINLFWPRTGTGINKLHHKLMVIDNQVVIAGSFNYTNPANALNDENILVIGDINETNATARANQQRFANYALQEINRIQAQSDPIV